MTESKSNEEGVDLETGSVTSLDARSQLGSDIHILGINYFTKSENIISINFASENQSQNIKISYLLNL